MPLDMPTIGEYLNDKARIKKLEAKILALNQQVSELKRRLNISPRINKEKLVDLLMKGRSAADAARLSKCSKSTANRIMRELKLCGALADKEPKSLQIISLRQAGMSYQEIALNVDRHIGYVRTLCSEVGLTNNAIRK